jgi:hypothetical protein
MTWTALLTYTADGLTARDARALAKALGGADVAYAAGRLRVQLEVEATTLRAAADKALRTAAAATGLLKPTHLQIQPTEELLDQAMEPMTLDLIGITEIATELGVSRQRRQARRCTRLPRPRRTSRLGPHLHPRIGQGVPTTLGSHPQPPRRPAPPPADHDHRENEDTLMTDHIDRTLPHHAALGLVIYTRPRRHTTLDDRTPEQIRRDANSSHAPATAGKRIAHQHFHRKAIR